MGIIRKEKNIMTKIKAFAISCSSDGEVHASRLFIWGQLGSKSWLPTTKSEAKKRVVMCQHENKCKMCDYEIHPIEIERTAQTHLQYLNGPKKHN